MNLLNFQNPYEVFQFKKKNWNLFLIFLKTNITLWNLDVFVKRFFITLEILSVNGNKSFTVISLDLFQKHYFQKQKKLKKFIWVLKNEKFI